MNINNYLETIHLLNQLKDTTRHCFTPGGRHEDVAEHTWRMTMMAFFVRDEFPDADMDKVIKMCLIHDLGEIFTGDIPTFDKTDADEEKEQNLLTDWVKSLPEPYSSEMLSLYGEMDALTTKEAKIYKAMDRIEAVISHNEADISTWAENEYELQLTYGNGNVIFSDYLTKFRNLVREESKEKIRKEAGRDVD